MPKQIELYEAKFEEWSTPNRLYCPVPTCSTFIPPKLYSSRISTPTNGELNSSNFTFSPQTSQLMEQVACTMCHDSVCTKCRSLMHDGDCPESDMEPELEACLKELKIKRCPKCRSGVRRTLGCARIECRCGTRFCFHCLELSCAGQCSFMPTHATGSQAYENRENGIIDRHHGDSSLSRDSQRAIILKDANYEHKFQYAQLHNDSNGNTLHECIICAKHLRAVQISESKKPSLILNDTEKDSNVSHKRAKGSEIAWEYRCGMIVCGICKDAYTKVHAAMP